MYRESETRPGMLGHGYPGPFAPERFTLGAKLMDGLRAIEAYQRDGAMGYPPKVADRILDRLSYKDLIECGVSSRTGWLTERGKRALYP